MMKKSFRIIAAILLLCMHFASTAIRASGPAAALHRSRSFEFTYKATVKDVPSGTKHLNVWLPYPTADANQEIYDMEVSSPSSASIYVEPRFGNSILFVSIDDPKAAPFDILMTFKVRRSENLKKDFAAIKNGAAGPLDPEIAEFLKPDKLVPVTPEIKRWAEEVTRGKKTDLERARAIYDYSLKTLKYDKSGEGWGRGDILYACDAKHGNCTDFHALFIGFARAVGIPARFSIGFPLPEKRGEGEIQGYHCWAEFYIKGYGWVPVDSSEAWKHPEKRDYFFGGHDENRVQFSTGRDIVLRPRQQAGPLNYFIYPYAEADGKPVQTVSREFHFRDLSDEARMSTSAKN